MSKLEEFFEYLDSIVPEPPPLPKSRAKVAEEKLSKVDLPKQRQVVRQAQARLVGEEDRQISAAEHNQRVLKNMQQRNSMRSAQDLRQFAIDHWMEAKLFAEAQERRHRAALNEYLELW
jgi:hypothetical protein